MTNLAKSHHSSIATRLRRRADPGKRDTQATRLLLVELDPRSVVDGVRVASGFMGEDAPSVGMMRETCPYCGGLPLQLVLRQGHVIRSHLVCKACTRCFDAAYPDGSSALTVPAGLSID
jgi:hypothetical protein